MRLRRAILVLSATACLAATTPPSPPAAALDQALTAYAAADRPGCAAGVMEGGRLAYARGYGVADIETRQPITPQTPFNLASMSKAFTGAAIALLIRDGRLNEDDDIRRYLPELRDYGRPIRIRHLLHHTSGLRNHMALSVFQPTGPLPTHEQALALVFRQSALNFAPGTRHQYDSPNYVLLAEIVARVSGMPFPRFLEARIFRPLGMRHTGFSVPGLARAYAVQPDGSFRLNEAVNRAMGSSGLVSTLDDFAIWLGALDSGRLGDPELLRRMMAPERLADGTIISYGYGLASEQAHDGLPGLAMIGHGGQTAAYRSTFSYFPGRGFGAILLCNVSNAPLDAANAAVEAWVETLPHPPAIQAVSSPQLPAEDVARLAGFYLDPVGDELRQFTAEEGALKLVYFGQAYPLRHTGHGRYELEGAGSFRFADGRLTETAEGQARIAYDKLPPAEPRPPGDYAGDYRSADVDGHVAMRADGDRLVMTLAGQDVPLDPVHTDGFAAFTSGFGHIAFQRGADGRVTGFTLSDLAGINLMRFARAPDRG